MTTNRNPRYWIEKKAHRKTGYPVATIAYYGPDDKFASKLVVGIVKSNSKSEPSAMKKWFSQGKDLRFDDTVNQEVLEFIQAYNVERVATIDRIIGCPHEEGIDYPVGEACPQCPFWANVDRWTGQRIG